MAILKIARSAKKEGSDSLHIKRGHIKASVTALQFKDADTHQSVVFIPSLGISGYGETREKAEEIVKFNMDEFFKYIVLLSQKKRDSELAALGWKQNKLKAKEFSNAYVDGEGELKEFNALDGKIERLTLVSQSC